jgi:glycosyltransferase involved in cell wall biosynthesis
VRIALNGRFYAARPTGVQRFAREVSARLLARDDVTVLLPRSARLPNGRSPSVKVTAGILDGRAWEQIELPLRIRAGAFPISLHLAQSAPRFGQGLVVMVHDVTPLTNPTWYTRAFVLWFRMALVGPVQRAARILASSEWTKRELVRLLGLDAERIDVVSQGVEPFDRPAAPAEVAHARGRRQLPDVYLLGVGGAQRRKNTAFLFDVLRHWPETHGTPPTLVLVGAPYRHLHMRIPARAAGGYDIRVLGHVEDEELRALYTGAAALCFPSLSEGFGRPPLEAMGCGTPAVCAPYGAAHEVLDHAAVVLPLDAALWARTLARLVSTPAELADLRERGQRHVAPFTWDRATRQVLASCRRAAEPRHREDAA